MKNKTITIEENELIKLIHEATGDIKHFVCDNEGWLRDHLTDKNITVTSVCPICKSVAYGGIDGNYRCSNSKCNFSWAIDF